ncbi:MAG TPA: hypothetical protein VF593_01725 [Chthoniobacteraceae bacterium]|jgi:hypothetical protein
MVTLPCPQCAYENELERVYCHNCGAKLDRSLLPKVEENKKLESAEKARKRIKRMTNPTGASFGREVKTLIKTLFFGALVAALVLMARRPDGVPEEKRELGKSVQSEVMDALESPSPRALMFTDNDLNLALKQSLRSKDTSVIPGLKFDRAYVNFLPGTVRVGNQQSLWNFPLFSEVDYQVTTTGGKAVGTMVGGKFGRLAVDPRLMEYLDFSFEKLWAAMKRERGFLDKMQSITITKGQVMLVTKGAATQ